MQLCNLLLFPLLATAAILTFDDLSVPNEGSCGSLSLVSTPYKGIRISGGGVVNTTQTQSCHQSSGGSGPWGFAVSQPNLLAGYDNTVFSSVKKFSVKELRAAVNIHWTLLQAHPELQVVITTTGKKANGQVVKTQQRVYGRDEIANWTLVLIGYKKLGIFEVGVKVRYQDETGAWVGGPIIGYFDDVEVHF